MPGNPPPPESQETPARSGKLAILAIGITAVALGGFAVWYHYQQGRRILQLWGPESAQRIRHAAEVELLELASTRDGDSGGAEETMRLGSQEVRITRRTSITRRPGLVHARHALIQDSSYDWSPQPEDRAAPNWDFALRFRDASGQVTLAFDTGRRSVLLIEDGTSARMTPVIERLHKYVQDIPAR